jgi:hypothetical protein
MLSQPARNLNQAEITTADRQSTTQPAVNATPAGTVSDATSVNKPTSQTNQSDRTTDEKPKHDLIDHINLLSTAAIAVFTFMLFLVIRRQDRAMKIAERAWLVSDIGSLEPTKSADLFQVICKIHNKGRTPAWITGMASSGKYVKNGGDLPENIDYPQKAAPFTERGSVLPPGAYTETGIPITNNHIQLVTQGEGIFYFLGFVDYRDVFEMNHHTRYCYQLKASQDLTSRTFEFYIGGPDRFNSAD